MTVRQYTEITTLTELHFNNIDPHYEITKHERITAFFAIALTLLLRIVFIFRYQFDSDESQHLHIVWGWAHGLLQYRDLFDNHTPLFHILSVPLYFAFDDNPNVLFFMRLAMVPLYAAVLWCTYLIGREIISYRAGIWAAIFTGLYPSNFLCSVQYRPDNLWTVFWLFAIAVLIKKQIRPLRCFYAGLLLGAAMGTSIKTSLLLFALAAAAFAVIIFFYNRYQHRNAVFHLARCAAALIAGLSVIPALLTLFFYLKGGLAPFLYQTIGYNALPVQLLSFKSRVFIFPGSLVLLCLIARGIIRHCSEDTRKITRCVFVLFTGGFYIAALEAFWPLLEWEHYLPFYPLFIIVVTPLILKVPFTLQARCIVRSPAFCRFLIFAVPLFFAVMETGSILGFADGGAPWKNGCSTEINLLNDVLRLTSPEDFVADFKGETIFRPRSSYYVLEKITRKRFERGLLPDDIPERLIKTRTCVATLDDIRFPDRARIFLNRNYVSVGRLRVAGQLLPGTSESMSSISFNIQIPARYVLVSQDCAPSGLLDNIPYDGERFLEVGHHEFRPAFPSCRFALLWAKASRLGFSPFT